MPNTFTTTQTTGYGTRIVNSFRGIVFGIIFIIGSFALLYWNEGRYDLSLLAKQTTAIDAGQITTDQSLQGKAISVTGNLTAHGQIDDNLFLKSGSYIYVARKTEVYAWVETKHSQSQTNGGGSQTTATTYTYSEQWVENPTPTSQFAEPDGHNNPQKIISSDNFRPSNVSVGAYPISEFGKVNLLDQEGTGLALNSQDLTLNGDAVVVNQDITLPGKPVLASSDYIFLPATATSTDSLSNPQLGDERISYSVIDSGISATVMGKLDGSQISSYFDQGNNELYLAYLGTRDEAIAQLHSDYTTSKWILRGVGFFLMFLGFILVASPIATILDIVPIIGGITSGFIFLVALVVSLVLSIVTILVSMLIHNIIALIIAVVVAVALIIFLLKLKKKKPDLPTSPSGMGV